MKLPIKIGDRQKIMVANLINKMASLEDFLRAQAGPLEAELLPGIGNGVSVNGMCLVRNPPVPWSRRSMDAMQDVLYRDHEIPYPVSDSIFENVFEDYEPEPGDLNRTHKSLWMGWPDITAQMNPDWEHSQEVEDFMHIYEKNKEIAAEQYGLSSDPAGETEKARKCRRFMELDFLLNYLKRQKFLLENCMNEVSDFSVASGDYVIDFKAFKPCRTLEVDRVRLSLMKKCGLSMEQVIEVEEKSTAMLEPKPAYLTVVNSLLVDPDITVGADQPSSDPLTED